MSKHLQSESVKPEFHSYFGFFPRILKNLLNGQIENPIKYSFDKGLHKAIRSSKRLYLNRMVKFNGKYFSSVSIPAFPSKAYNNMYRNGGLNFREAGTPLKRHFETALLGISDVCPLDCEHCYEKENLKVNSKVSINDWKGAVSKLQKKGVSIIVLTGGEPLIAFDKTMDILNSGDKDLSDFHIHTSGFSLTPEKATSLKKAGLMAAAVGLDDYDEVRNDRIRGKGSFRQAVEALKIFNEAGIMTYVNFCASKELLRKGSLYRYYDFVKSLNISFIQLLEPRSCGGYLDQDDVLLTSEDKKVLKEFSFNAAFDKRFRNYPVVYYVAHIEDKKQNGCNMGALSILYIDTKGNVNPCVFMPVSFGNIVEEDLDNILSKMRKSIPRPVHKECPSLLLTEDIRKGHKLSGKMPVPFEVVEEQWNKKLYNSTLE